ncbi:MAG: TlyA family RNA methyltransferase [Rhizobiales bacterium]|nr:TlyA family RNA methyltransferase [Hyphomicrobiales bacterium]
MVSDARRRLDQILTERGFARSRAQAADMVRRGAVLVDGALAAKPGRTIRQDAEITLDRTDAGLVSRAGAKLIHALNHFAIDPSGLTCLDIGASTGGFCQALLERGAARIYAVDVGHGQLHAEVAGDTRVINLQGTDARTLSRQQVPEAADLITADVSFISLAKALPAALALATDQARLVALVKPQFELGPQALGKDGVVRDEAARLRALENVTSWLEASGWKVTGHTLSPLAGKTGNLEWLVAAVRS